MKTISLKNIQVERDGRALFEPIELVFSSHALIALTGSNGSGKTTLLETLAGIRRYERSNQELSTVQKRSKYFSHKSGITHNLTCLENLMFLSTIENADLNKEQLLELLDTVNLSGYEHTLATDLSAGQKRKLSLLRLHFLSNSIWLLDEPYTNLDSAGEHWLNHQLSQHLDNGGCAMLSVHHQSKLFNRATQTIQLNPI